jgi:translation initiation factor 1
MENLDPINVPYGTFFQLPHFAEEQRVALWKREHARGAGDRGMHRRPRLADFGLVPARQMRHMRFVMADSTRIPLGPQPFGQNPFAALSSENLPVGPADPPAPETPVARPARNRGRVDILRQKAGRGGKTVTVVTNFVGIGLPEKEQLAKAMQKSCGTGGTVKEGRIEIQGDKRAEVARILEAAGFRPVMAGG